LSIYILLCCSFPVLWEDVLLYPVNGRSCALLWDHDRSRLSLPRGFVDIGLCFLDLIVGRMVGYAKSLLFIFPSLSL